MDLISVALSPTATSSLRYEWLRSLGKKQAQDLLNGDQTFLGELGGGLGYGYLSAEFVGALQVSQLLQIRQPAQLSKEALAGLSAEQAKGLVGNISFLSNLSSNAAGLTAKFLQALSLSQVGQITASMSSAMTSDQIKALVFQPKDHNSNPNGYFLLNALSAAAAAALTTKALGNLDGSDAILLRVRTGMRTTTLLSNLQGNAQGLTAAFIGSLDTAQLNLLTPTAVAALTPSALGALDANDAANLQQAAGPTFVARLQANASGLSTAFLGALTTVQIAAISATAMAGLTAAQLGSWTTTQIKALTTVQIAAITKAAFSGLTKAQLDSWSTAQIGALSAAVVSGITTDQFKAWSGAQISALSTDAVSGFTATQLGSWSVTQIDALKPAQIAAITPAAMAGLMAAQLGSWSVSQIDALKPAQINALTVAAMAGLTATQLGSWTTTQIKALTTVQIAAITKAAFSGLTKAQLDSWSTAQIGALSAAAVSGITTDQFKAWSGAQISALSADAVSGFTATQLGSWSVTQIDALKPAQINALTVAAMAGLTAAQLGSWTPVQIKAFTTAQIPKITAAAMAGLTAAQLGSWTTDQIGALTATQVPFLGDAVLAASESRLSPAQLGSLSLARLAAVAQLLTPERLAHWSEIGLLPYLVPLMGQPAFDAVALKAPQAMLAYALAEQIRGASGAALQALAPLINTADSLEPLKALLQAPNITKASFLAIGYDLVADALQTYDDLALSVTEQGWFNASGHGRILKDIASLTQADLATKKYEWVAKHISELSHTQRSWLTIGQLVDTSPATIDLYGQADNFITALALAKPKLQQQLTKSPLYKLTDAEFQALDGKLLLQDIAVHIIFTNPAAGTWDWLRGNDTSQTNSLFVLSGMLDDRHITLITAEQWVGKDADGQTLLDRMIGSNFSSEKRPHYLPLITADTWAAPVADPANPGSTIPLIDLLPATPEVIHLLSAQLLGTSVIDPFDSLPILGSEDGDDNDADGDA
ncbi:hypothetical protein Bpro_5533 (plasmid) [Polaromonas sp. JS666]|nr:hypothetical protein Bpro_5533 [Polaromonas sp. JS666]